MTEIGGRDEQVSVWCSQCDAQWYCDLEDSPPPDRRRLVLDPILCESCAAEVRGPLEARVKQEFDIATGYHRRWQQAEARIGRLLDAVGEWRSARAVLFAVQFGNETAVERRIEALTNAEDRLLEAHNAIADNGSYPQTTCPACFGCGAATWYRGDAGEVVPKGDIPCQLCGGTGGVADTRSEQDGSYPQKEG
jgi:hypothetical protein